MGMEKTVNVSCRFSFRTQFWLAQLVFARSRVGLFFYGTFIGIPILAFGTVPVQGAQWISHPANWIGFCIMLAVPLLVLPLCTALNIWRARRRNEWLRGILRFAITPEAFEAHGDGFDVRLRWDVLEKVIETSGSFLFYVGPMMAHIIPKACVASHTDIERIRTIVDEAIGPKAKLRAA
jgi:hypothetical protein